MPKQKKSKNVPVQPVFRIFCEGEKTEPQYIRGYISHFHSDQRRIILVEDTNKNTPVQLVDLAVERKKQGTDKDIIWVVYDRESESKYSHALHAKARKKAKDNHIEIAFSNVCFEYWILLHFAYTAGPYNSYKDLIKKSTLKKEVKELGINDYEKSLPILFDKLKSKVVDAIANAERLKKQAEISSEPGKSEPHFLNPYVDVHEMFQDMQQFIDGNGSVRSKSKH